MHLLLLTSLSSLATLVLGYGDGLEGNHIGHYDQAYEGPGINKFDLSDWRNEEFDQYLCGKQHWKHHCDGYDCCSKAGYCGLDSRACNRHSQKDYGWTPDELYFPPPPPKLKVRESSGMRCGKDFDNTVCEASECCSELGVCGTGPGFCTAPGCQAPFGFCDAEKTPEGLDPSVDRDEDWALPVANGFIDRCTRPRTLALTFDDGPNKHTSKILDLLEENNATATFFVAGISNDKGQIDITTEWIQEIKRMAVNGHQVASHTWSHPHLDDISQGARNHEMYKNERAIANIIGAYPTYMRPPYSECSTFKETSCLSDMAKLGYRIVGFELDTADTEIDSTLESMKAAIDKAFSGKSPDDNMLVIQHEHSRFSYEVTKYLIEKAHELDWKVDTVGNCLNDDHPNWLRLPQHIAPKDMVKGGCHFVTPGFCGVLTPFTDKRSCFDSALQCRRDARKCDQEDCPLFEIMCEITMKHCSMCEGDECTTEVFKM